MISLQSLLPQKCCLAWLDQLHKRGGGVMSDLRNREHRVAPDVVWAARRVVLRLNTPSCAVRHEKPTQGVPSDIRECVHSLLGGWVRKLECVQPPPQLLSLSRGGRQRGEAVVKFARARFCLRDGLAVRHAVRAPFACQPSCIWKTLQHFRRSHNVPHPMSC